MRHRICMVLLLVLVFCVPARAAIRIDAGVGYGWSSQEIGEVYAELWAPLVRAPVADFGLYGAQSIMPSTLAGGQLNRSLSAVYVSVAPVSAYVGITSLTHTGVTKRVSDNHRLRYEGHVRSLLTYGVSTRLYIGSGYIQAGVEQMPGGEIGPYIVGDKEQPWRIALPKRTTFRLSTGYSF